MRTVATTHVADGLWMSRAGVLYLTSPGENAVTRLVDGRIETVLTDKRLRWPDTFSEVQDVTGGQFPVQFPPTGDVARNAEAERMLADPA